MLPIKIHDVFYEELVSNPQKVGMEIAEAAGLEWSETALDQTRSKKDVATASQWQVREKIYDTSVQKWKRYEKHMQPLADELRNLANDYDEELGKRLRTDA